MSAGPAAVRMHAEAQVQCAAYCRNTCQASGLPSALPQHTYPRHQCQGSPPAQQAGWQPPPPCAHSAAQSLQAQPASDSREQLAGAAAAGSLGHVQANLTIWSYLNLAATCSWQPQPCLYCPSSPVMMFLAWSCMISNICPSSTTCCTTLCMSYACRQRAQQGRHG